MSYLKVKWNRSFPDEPMLLYSELDRERWAVRKVEFLERAKRLRPLLQR
jgi:hypothetical protein